MINRSSQHITVCVLLIIANDFGTLASSPEATRTSRCGTSPLRLEPAHAISVRQESIGLPTLAFKLLPFPMVPFDERGGRRLTKNNEASTTISHPVA